MAEIAAYLARLGVSHLYLSPYLTAAPGSSHGYDIVDPASIDEQLGGESAHRRMLQALAAHGLGQLIDVVPNHMAFSHGQNRWWQDVLEFGPQSSYARHFDIAWRSPEPRLWRRVLLPVLAEGYGASIVSGKLRLRRSGADVEVCYEEGRFPINLPSLADLLAEVGRSGTDTELGQLAVDLGRLRFLSFEPSRRRVAGGPRRELRAARRRLQDMLHTRAELGLALDHRLDSVNRNPDELDELLERQHYRLAHWRAASRDLNYRRFFDNNKLVGLRVEDRKVFNDHHSLLLGWVRAGLVGGLRVDHPDGLRDPAGYLRRLRHEAPGVWAVVEKILEPGELLPEDWPADGTTGYDFARLAMGLFVDPAGETKLTATYRWFAGESRSFFEVALEGKRLAVRELLGSDLNRLTDQFLQITEAHRDQRDHTRHELHEVLAELAASLPVYRTYLRAGMSESVARQASQDVSVAAARVRGARPDLDPALLTFAEDLLSLRVPGNQAVDLALRFQQLTGAVMAKGVEDTALYRFHRLISLNEVGDDPGQFGVSLEKFHAGMADRQRRWPRTMNSTSTHDSKRSEDVRSRISLLSEVPGQWEHAVRRWARLNGRHRRGQDLPDRNFEYFFYQTMVGAWPVPSERLWPVLEKSMREAKVHTSWSDPQPEYEDAVRHFVMGALDDRSFLADFSRFVSGLVRPARISSLAVALLRLTAPGIPDTYQGTDLWDHSLVDPDNRRPVDFSHRLKLLDQLPGMSPEQVLCASDSGLPKLWTLSTALGVRQRCLEAFGDQGQYRPLVATGRRRENVVAYARGERVVTVVPRLPIQLRSGWDDTTIELPPGCWTEQFTAEIFKTGAVAVGKLLHRFPVALLVRGGDS